MASSRNEGFSALKVGGKILGDILLFAKRLLELGEVVSLLFSNVLFQQSVKGVELGDIIGMRGFHVLECFEVLLDLWQSIRAGPVR